MRAALLFAQGLERDGLMARVASVRAELYGSLGATGKGHGTDKGVLLGLMGEAPDTVDPAAIAGLLASVRSSRQLSLLGRHTVPFIEKEHMMFYRREALAEHPNGMKFHAYDAEGRVAARVALPVRGRRFRGHGRRVQQPVIAAHDQLPFPFRTGRELLTMCKESGLTVAQLMMKNELTRDEAEVNGGLDRIWQVMQDCVARGCGITTRGRWRAARPLRVRRRAPSCTAT